ncbi:hypothetical protein ACS0TY_034255 [Phlomoides rotata]
MLLWRSLIPRLLTSSSTKKHGNGSDGFFFAVKEVSLLDQDMPSDHSWNIFASSCNFLFLSGWSLMEYEIWNMFCEFSCIILVD